MICVNFDVDSAEDQSEHEVVCCGVRLRAILADAPAQRLLSPTGEKVRNRSVHYEMNDPTIIPDLARPMNGLVEAICSSWSWESFDQDVREITECLAELLADWKP
jgi:hypothetical protein